MKRIYPEVVRRRLEKFPQMLFLMGPRQVGKTTASLLTGEQLDHLHYFNWDDDSDRTKILEGPSMIASRLHLEEQGEKSQTIIFDEIHKYSKWKTFLKGFFDKYGKYAMVMVTGSARLDVYQRGGDSLMGRYFRLRMHPFSVSEIVNPSFRSQEEIRKNPIAIDAVSWEKLLQFGGFPQPFVAGDPELYHLWKGARYQLLFREDLRDLTRIQELDQVERLAEILQHSVGGLVSYSSLARKIRASDDTIRRWIETLRSLYYCFELRPWSRNVTRSLIKEPKYYLWDWSLLDDEGARFENLVASHLLKAVHFWNDMGYGDYGLHFLRDKEKREVDFLVTKNNTPWFLVEAKLGQSGRISKALHHYHKQLETKHAFQVVCNMPYVEYDYFQESDPVIVPAQTFLSQLV